MYKIEWDKRYSVNIEELDRQHKEIINVINNLYIYFEQEDSAESRNAIHNALTKLTEYASVHFETEERMLKEAGFPDLVSHTGEHVNFSRKILELNMHFDSNKRGLKYDILNFLHDWLDDHILVDDKKYSLWFKEKLLAGKKNKIIGIASKTHATSCLLPCGT